MNPELINYIKNIQKEADKDKKNDILDNQKLLKFLNQTILTDDESDYLFIGDKTTKGVIQLAGMTNSFGKLKKKLN